MFCPKCGKELSDGAKFCPMCGNALLGQNNSEAAQNQNRSQTEKKIEVNPEAKNHLWGFCLIGNVILIICGIVALFMAFFTDITYDVDAYPLLRHIIIIGLIGGALCLVCFVYSHWDYKQKVGSKADSYFESAEYKKVIKKFAFINKVAGVLFVCALIITIAYLV